MDSAKPVVSWKEGCSVITAGTSWLTVSSDGRQIFRTRALVEFGEDLAAIDARRNSGPVAPLGLKRARIMTGAGCATFHTATLKDVQGWLAIASDGQGDGVPDSYDLRLARTTGGELHLTSPRFPYLAATIPVGLVSRFIRLCLLCTELPGADDHPETPDWYRRVTAQSFSVAEGGWELQFTYSDSHEAIVMIREERDPVAFWTLGRSALPGLIRRLGAVAGCGA